MMEIDLEQRPDILKYISDRLIKRKLAPLVYTEWIEQQGEEFDYKVYVGTAEIKGTHLVIDVAVFPEAVYKLDDKKDWNKRIEKNKIPYE